MTRRVLVVEDDRRLHEPIAGLLASAALSVRFAATATRALAELSATGVPDVMFVDLGLPDLDGVELIESIHARYSELPIVVLSIASSPARVLAALRAGASGYLLKEDIARLPAAVDEVLDGGSPMSRAVGRLLVEQTRAPTAPVAADPPPSREIEVVDLLARGLTYGDIAQTLGVSINTVRTHVRRLYARLDVRDKAEAVMTAMRLGLIER